MLAFLYFVNADDMLGPMSEQEWHGAVRLIYAALVELLPAPGTRILLVTGTDCENRLVAGRRRRGQPNAKWLILPTPCAARRDLIPTA